MVQGEKVSDRDDETLWVREKVREKVRRDEQERDTEAVLDTV